MFWIRLDMSEYIFELIVQDASILPSFMLMVPRHDRSLRTHKPPHRGCFKPRGPLASQGRDRTGSRQQGYSRTPKTSSDMPWTGMALKEHWCCCASPLPDAKRDSQRDS